MEKINYENLKEDELRDIVCSCVVGNRKSQEKLYHLFYRRMMSLVRTYVSCPHKSEEALNNGFLKAFQKIHQYRHEGSFEGWLRRVMYHSTMSYIKQDKAKTSRIVFIEKESSQDAVHNLYFNQLLEIVDKLPKMSKFFIYILLKDIHMFRLVVCWIYVRVHQNGTYLQVNKY